MKRQRLPPSHATEQEDEHKTICVRFDPTEIEKIERVRNRLVTESLRVAKITTSDAIRWMVKSFPFKHSKET